MLLRNTKSQGRQHAVCMERGGWKHKFRPPFSVNNCTGSNFEPSRIAHTGNKESSSIAACTHSDVKMYT